MCKYSFVSRAFPLGLILRHFVVKESGSLNGRAEVWWPCQGGSGRRLPVAHWTSCGALGRPGQVSEGQVPGPGIGLTWVPAFLGFLLLFFYGVVVRKSPKTLAPEALVGGRWVFFIIG